MENRPTKLDKIVKISIIIGVLIVALSTAYYLIIFLPQKEKTRIEQQDKLEKAKKDCAQEVIDKAKKNTGAIASDYNFYIDICMGIKGF
jgi:flagellar basal body-associated protein FliL